MILSSLVLPDDRPKDWQNRKPKIIKRVLDFIGRPCQKPVALEPEIMQEDDCGDYLRRKVSYWVAEGDRCFSYLLMPRNIKEPRPAVITFHETNRYAKDACAGLAPKAMKYRDYAVHLVKRGYICLAPDYFCAGERLKTGEAPYDKTNFYKKYPQWSAVGKGAYDGARDIDYLCTLPEVDRSKITAIGHSLGGDRAVHTAVFDNRVSVVVCSCGLWPFFGLNKRAMHAMKWLKGWEGRNPVMIPKETEYARNMLDYPYDLHELFSLLAPRPLLLSYGFSDANANNLVMNHEVMHHLNRLYRLLGKEHHFAHLFHGDGHETLLWIQNMMYAFLDRFTDPLPLLAD